MDISMSNGPRTPFGIDFTKPVPLETTTIGLGNPLVSAGLSQPPLHIPNTLGEVYKTELVVVRRDDYVEKINWWHAPDDVDDRSRPHNHPWSFESEVLHGELIEIRYTPVYLGDDLLGYRRESFTRRAGETYHCPSDTFHVVVSVTPGTVTRMKCGPVVNNPWGYLSDLRPVTPDGNLVTGIFAPAEKDPKFLERLWQYNPFKRPKT